MRSNLCGYMDAAIAKAKETPVAGTPHLVTTWFGTLDATQTKKLTDMLGAMRTALLACSTSLPTASRGTIRLVPGALNARYGEAYYAQVRGLGWANAKMPVYSIEVGKFHLASSYGEKVATVFHEFSHRTAGTIDVVVGAVTQYGTANCQALATTTPDLALTNADNYGYFIGFCTKTLGDTIPAS